MKIRPEVNDAMRQLGIQELREHQNKIINSILDGNDTMVSAKTSFGKSLCYLIPAIIQRGKVTVVIEPLLSLMHDQVNKLKDNIHIRAKYLDSSQDENEKAYQT